MIFSSKYINLFVVVLVLVSLLGPFESVSTEKISRRDRNGNNNLFNILSKSL